MYISFFIVQTYIRKEIYMRRTRLRKWVIPVFAFLVLTSILLTYNMVGNIINYSYEPEQDYVSDSIVVESIPVNKEVEEKEPTKKTIIKPINSETVMISKYFYNQKDDEEKQQSSLIRYANIYMPNTGLLYSSDNDFDVIAVLDGKVSNIKNDDILGTIIEVEHDNNIVTIYQSVKNVKVKAGQKVKQGDVIATSGPNKLEEEKSNCLHFEVYKDGNLMNPEEFYKMEIE